MRHARSTRPSCVDHRLDSFDGGSIYVVESGEGPPIVLSHGVTNSIREWFHQLESLPRAGFRTIAFDHRGHGQSVVGTAGHSLDNLAHDMRTVVEGLDLHDAVLVGHSMGGVAVQAFVTHFPEIAAERVAGIVLLSTLAKTPLGSHSTRTKKRIEQITNHAPDMTLGVGVAEPRSAARPHRVRPRSRTRATWSSSRQMLAECPPRDARSRRRAR